MHDQVMRPSGGGYCWGPPVFLDLLGPGLAHLYVSWLDKSGKILENSTAYSDTHNSVSCSGLLGCQPYAGVVADQPAQVSA